MALGAVLFVACTADPVTPPLAPDQLPALGKTAATGLTVSSTLPKSGDKGQTLDVHVYGSGFAAGATATWALHGVADPSKVKTNSTTVVSSTELIANITIAPDATIDYWDVQVTAAFCCKTGIGTEMFEVTSALPVGPGSAAGVNDAGDIVGQFTVSNAAHAFVVSGADASLSDLGLRRATAISQDGLTTVGGIDSYAGVWTRAAGAPWPTAGARLPDLPGMTQASGLANAIATVAAENVTVITGVLTVPFTPVYWESTDGTWTAPARALPVPAGYTGTVNSAMAIATNGDIAGQLQNSAGNGVAAVWRRVSGGYIADVLPLPAGYTVSRIRSISPDGTILAGNVKASSKGKDVLAPAFWTRNTNGSYAVQLLPTLSGTLAAEGAVYGVTVVGTQVRAVGTSPSTTNSGFIHAALWTWTVGATDFAVRDIGGVGTKTGVTPFAINAAGTIAAGADGNGSIKWLLMP